VRACVCSFTIHVLIPVIRGFGKMNAPRKWRICHKTSVLPPVFAALGSELFCQKGSRDFFSRGIHRRIADFEDLSLETYEF
jgi:hypothetical protein